MVRDTESFIKKAKEIHNNEYDYSLVEYKKAHNKVKIICKIHGVFEQRPCDHNNKPRWCPKCNGGVRHTQEQFLKKAFKIQGDKYDYSLVNYVNSNTKIKIICPVHGVFEQAPHKHIIGQGCPSCKESIGEKRIRVLLENSDIGYIKEYKFNDCLNDRKFKLPFDFYLPDFNLCIEFDGKQHFDKNSKYYSEYLIENDEVKNLYCKKNNINLLRIPFWNYYKLEEILGDYLYDN